MRTSQVLQQLIILLLLDQRGKVDKYKLAADAMRAVHLPFAVESMGGLSESAQQLIREIHHSAGDHNTWRDAAIIGTHLVDAVAIAVQRCTGMALQKSQWRERQRAWHHSPGCRRSQHRCPPCAFATPLLDV